MASGRNIKRPYFIKQYRRIYRKKYLFTQNQLFNPQNYLLITTSSDAYTNLPNTRSDKARIRQNNSQTLVLKLLDSRH